MGWEMIETDNEETCGVSSLGNEETRNFALKGFNTLLNYWRQYGKVFVP